jgi:hypothetical protein
MIHLKRVNAALALITWLFLLTALEVCEPHDHLGNVRQREYPAAHICQ